MMVGKMQQLTNEWAAGGGEDPPGAKPPEVSGDAVGGGPGPVHPTDCATGGVFVVLPALSRLYMGPLMPGERG